MASYDWLLASHQRLCSYANTFAHIATQSIFAKITDLTTPAQFDAAQRNLFELCQRLEAQMDMFHFPAAVGTHHCVRDIFTDASFRLKNLALMQPPPPLPPAPKQQLLTVDGVLINLEDDETLPSPDETYLGSEDAPPTNGNNR